MKRRDFIRLLGGSAATWPLLAHAQQSALPVLGFLAPGSAKSDAFRIADFRRGLNEVGYVEGQSVTIKYRWAENQFGRLPELAAQLVQQKVAVIVAISNASSLAAKAATATIPIVFAVGADPVQLGLVASFNQPGTNATGVSFFTLALETKKLELLRKLVPAAANLLALADEVIE